MKHFIKFVSFIGLLAVSHFAYAGSINRTFVDGDILEAIHLNEATTAINDNDARITNINNPPVSVVVNCPMESVQQAINNVKHGLEFTIFIIGQCNESVSIIKDGITLSGNNDGDGTIDGGLTEVKIKGAQRVRVEYLNITGAGAGVLVEEGASVDIVKNNIHDNTGGDGVGVFNEGFARVEFNIITGNGRATLFEAGIELGSGSTVLSRGNMINNNVYAAIAIGNMSYFRSGLRIPSGETLDPADKDTFIQGSGNFAVDCFRKGLCDFRNTDVTGNISISGLSNLDVETTTINGDIVASGGSGLHLSESVTGSGFVFCVTEAFASDFIQCRVSIPTPQSP